jgi:hypothetical protein
MNVDYLKIVTLIKEWGESHKEVKRVDSDFADQLPNFATDNKSYPILYIAPGNIDLIASAMTRSTLNSLSINCYCMDLVQEDRANISTVLNTTSLILSDLFKWISEEDFPGIRITRGASLRPLNNWGLDSHAGWQMTLNIEIMNYTWCSIPLSIPVGDNNVIF